MDKLTPEQIDALSRDELRIQCAEAMGWTWDSESVFWPGGKTMMMRSPDMANYFANGPIYGDMLLHIIPDYPRDNAAALTLLDEFDKNKTELVRRPYVTSKEWSCQIVGMDGFWIGMGELLSEAICRAYLKAIHDRRRIPHAEMTNRA